MHRLSAAAVAVLLLPAAVQEPAGRELLRNGDFEQGLEGWSPFWAREAGTGTAVPDAETRHAGARSVRITHTGARDWSLAHTLDLPVRPGDLLELRAWIRVEGAGDAVLGAVARDAAGKALDWSLGARRARDTRGWRLLRARFAVPPGTTKLQPRLIGYGPSTVWLDDVVLERSGTLDALRGPGLPPEVVVETPLLRMTLRTAEATFGFLDRRSGRTWTQQAAGRGGVVLAAKPGDPGTILLRLLDPVSMRELSATARLDPARPEARLVIEGGGEMEDVLPWPAPFASEAGGHLIVPVNEGIAYPVDDAALPEMHYHLYGGHGLCMPWYGSADAAGAGWMAIVETADDAALRIPRHDGRLVLSPLWEPQKGAFGEPRALRYVFFGAGGHGAMAKRYREHARETGLLKTLEEKRRRLPAVDLLVGAANVWSWDGDAPGFCRDLQAAGIRRILWSNARPPAELRELNAMGVLTSRYDIYQDAMDPAQFPKLRWKHPDWTSDAWVRDDLMIDARGDWIRGWEVETREGPMIPCGVLCDRQAVRYARERIPAELATHPYRSRFIDTTTAAPWRECHHPKHPVTRTESKRHKVDLLRVVSEEAGLVCGSETGHDAAVPVVHYFEGMLSLGPYRVPDSGRDMMRAWDEVPEAVAKFQTGHRYRLPLWELVYHDCVVSQWYWGDYNNKLPALWDRRDLWNALYGTPPMFMFDRKRWAALKDRFVRSYRTTAPLARATGYAEMLSHEWLTPDHAVQRTRFAGGIEVTVNFGDVPHELPGGALKPLELRVTGLRDEDPK